jgi:hypothetical protein
VPGKTGLLAVAVMLAGCGGSGVHKSPPQHVVPRPPVARSHAPQLVSMRRTDGATWETVIVRSDGTGDVGVFIGERAGTHHRGHVPRRLAGLVGVLNGLIDHYS